MKKNYWEKLEKIEQLASGSVIKRFLNNPFRYVSAVGYWRLIYPLKKKGRYVEAPTFFGANMQLVLPSATEIYLFGAKTHDSEIRLARYLMKHLQPGDTFCDVGAHFGYFSLLASNLVGPSGKVLSIEASKSTYGILKNNTAYNSNILTEHMAASDQDGIVTFHEFPALYSEYNSMVLPDASQSRWMQKNPPQPMAVKAQRLDDYFLTNNLLPNILKIDVEGAEPQVLEGLSNYIKDNSPIIIMEYLTDSSQQSAHREAVLLAKKYGYQSFVISNIGEAENCEDIEHAMDKRRLFSDNIILRKA